MCQKIDQYIKTTNIGKYERTVFTSSSIHNFSLDKIQTKIINMQNSKKQNIGIN
jgi:hypothetical protein